MFMGEEFGVVIKENNVEFIFGGFGMVVDFKCPCLRIESIWFDFNSLFIKKCIKNQIKIPIFKMESGIKIGYSNSFILESKFVCQMKILEYRLKGNKKIKMKIF